jgi:hypothetical protein
MTSASGTSSCAGALAVAESDAGLETTAEGGRDPGSPDVGSAIEHEAANTASSAALTIPLARIALRPPQPTTPHSAS